jgi:hypothetical protein
MDWTSRRRQHLKQRTMRGDAVVGIVRRWSHRWSTDIGFFVLQQLRFFGVVVETAGSKTRSLQVVPKLQLTSHDNPTDGCRFRRTMILQRKPQRNERIV